MTVGRFCKERRFLGPSSGDLHSLALGQSPASVFFGAATEEPEPAGGTHLGDLAPTEVGKALEGKRQDVGCPVDGEALAGGHLLLAPEGDGGQLMLPGLSSH